MPKNKRPIALPNARITISQMKSAINKIDRRLAELKNVNTESLIMDDQTITALETKLETTLSDIFGSQTHEYQKYNHITNLYSGAFSINPGGTTLYEYREGTQNGVNEAIAILTSIKDNFEEELEDAGKGETKKIIQAYEGLELHPAIASAANELFLNGHYSNAIEDSIKALNDIVRTKSGIELDGTDLMQKVFSRNNPILKFNDLKDESDRNEQQGFMFMFSGAVTGLRNPRAHKIIKDDPEWTLEIIAFISLLAKLVDKAKR